jgi:uncharacterized membrane protein YkvA (DUF1232 family)
MTIRGSLQKAVKSFSIEVLAMCFAFWDRCVRWYVKLILLFAMAYVVSPYDLINDRAIFWGQIDDIVVLRISYLICKKVIDPVILDNCRARATRYLDAGAANKVRFVAALILVWGFALFLIGKYLVHRMGNYELFINS